MRIRSWVPMPLLTLLLSFTLGACSIDAEPRARVGIDTIDLPVVAPTAVYAIPVETRPSDLKAFVSDAIKRNAPESMRTATLSRLAATSTKTEIWAKDRIPSVIFEMLQYSGTSPEEVKALSQAKEFIVIAGTGKPGWPPLHEFETRTAAASVAKALKTSAMDLFLPKAISIEDAQKDSLFQQRKQNFSQWSKVLNSDDENGLWMTTRGLGRIGLMEVQSIDVPPQLEDSWSYVMSALCWKIAKLSNEELKAGKTEIRLPSAIELTDKDLEEAFKSKISLKENTSARLFLTIARGRDEADYLTIIQPKGDTRKFGEYVVDITRELLGAHENPVIESRRSEAMQEAMATAKAELPTVRKRFLDKEFPFGSRLILKYRVERGADREYLWAYVTGWQDPKRIQAISGNDSDYDLKLRSGQLLNLDLETIVDWALMEKDKIVQGGYTTKVLEQEQKGLPKK
ncbi:MAG TPA: DUF2314 domain-containing protein [Candidatus Melainabacteria bacterium]|jgi:uncharacterized protein YegJ (DUF2314 family)|nr:DUF2314 domain-containing protein [Candidatus Melainabacteria bacterium]